ncbi:MAG: S8 family serine peptidase [Bacteroidota bacterium]
MPVTKNNVRLFVLDAQQKPITNARFELQKIQAEVKDQTPIKQKALAAPLKVKQALSAKERRQGLAIQDLSPGKYRLKVIAKGFESQERELVLDQAGKIISEVFILSKKGTPYFYKNNTRIPINAEASDYGLLVAQDFDHKAKKALSEKAKALGAKLVRSTKKQQEQGFWILRFPKKADQKAVKKAIATLRKNKAVQHINQMTQCSKQSLSILTDELVVQFDLSADRSAIESTAKKYGLKLGEQYPGAANLYLMRAKRKKGYDLLDICRKLVEEDKLVLSAEPLEISSSEDDLLPPLEQLYNEFWHLTQANVPAAWNALNALNASGVGIGTAGDQTYGSPNVIIGGVDRGLQSYTPPWGGNPLPTHHDFSGNVTNGSSKVVAFYDFTTSVANNDAPFSRHGMSISCVATGMVNNQSITGGSRVGAVGVAPNARIIGVIRQNGATTAYLGMFQWLAGLPNTSPAASLGNNTADIITNSWHAGFPVATANTAFGQLTNYGRNGRGVLLFFSAGNSNTDVTIQRPWAAHPKTFGIAATTLNAAGNERRATYSGFGVFGAGTQIELSSPSGSLGPHTPPANYGIYSGHMINSGNTVTGPGTLSARLTRATTNTDTIFQLDDATGFRPGQQILVADATNNILANFTINAANGLRSSMHIDISPGTAGQVLPIGTQILGLTPLSTTISAPGVLASNNVNTLPVGAIAGFQAGQMVLLGNVGAANQELRTISAAPAGGNIPINANISNDHGAGDPVSVVGGLIQTTVTSLNGARTVITVPTSAGFLTGHTLLVGTPGTNPPAGPFPEAATILSLTPTTITLTAALSGAHNAGAQIIGGANHMRNDFGGTSSGTPLAAGIAALILSAQPLLSWIEVRDILRTTAVKLDLTNTGFTTANVAAGRVIGQGIWQDAAGVDTIVQATGAPNPGAGAPHYSEWYGYGRVNAGAAVTTAIAYNHNQRDLMLRNWINLAVLDVNNIPTQDDGLTITNVNNNPIHSPDIWIRNNNNPLTGLDPNRPGPHQNPDQSVNRFIFARIKNRGTTLTSLDAWVRFYVALSNGANAAGPPAINTPFHFPTDWMAGNAIGIIGTNAGANTTYYVGEIALTQGAIAVDSYHHVSIQWNQAHLPPAGTPLNTYLLVQVSPTDGALNGRGAESVNNLSYREILFARFGFRDGTGASDLADTVEVSPYYQAVTTNFTLLLNADIGTFGTEKVSVEFIRENDNGTEETVTFLHTGGSWQFNGGVTPTWASMNAPTDQGAATPATGNKNAIAFTGTIDAAKEHNKITLRIKISSRNTTAVIAEDEKVITVTAQQLQPTGIGPSQPKVAPRSHVFTEMPNLVQTPALTYGPVPGNLNTKYRVTSSFNSAMPTKAYACVNGIFMIQKQDANRVNLILKPIKQPGLDFTPIRYFIYRGLKLSDFIKSAAQNEVRGKASASALIKRLYEIHEDQNPAGTTFLSKSLGYDPANQNVADLIDSYFYRSDPSYQLPFVTKGMHIGNFYQVSNSQFGFEIILEEGNYQPTLGFAQKEFHEITVPAANNFTNRIAREEILNFMDPAAFYSMHAVDKGLVEVPDPSGGPGDILKKKGDDIYHDIVKWFLSRNKLYIDIRNENGHSYNFYTNYKGPAGDPDLGKDIKIANTNTAGALTAANYQTNDWPILIRSGAVNVNVATTPIYLCLRIDDNIKPMVYVEQGKIKLPASKTNAFIEAPDLLPSGANPPWTKVIGFDLPNIGPNGAKEHKAWVLKLFYNRQLDNSTTWPPTVVRTEDYSDHIFGPLDFSPLWTSDQKIKWMGIQDKHLVDGSSSNFVYMAERGISFEGFVSGNTSLGRAIFYGVADDWLKAPGSNTNLANGITGGVSTRQSFFQVASFFQGLQLRFDVITVGGNSVSTLELVPSSGLVPPSSMLVLGITRPELTTLKALSGFQTNIDRTVTLEKIASTNDPSGKSYTTYRLVIKGLDSSGNYKTAKPATDIVVYTRDGFLFASDDFTKDEPLPTTYSRNAEEAIGLIKESKPSGENFEDFFIKKDTLGAIGGQPDKMEKLVADFISAVGAVVNDSNAKSNLTTHIDNYAPKILVRARAFAANNNSANADDRILYWARLKMIVALKSHEYLLQSFTDRDELVQRFETKSRGFDSISFSGAPAGAKKVLIAGYDPFFLNPNYGGDNPRQSNPSGATALALHGQTLTEGSHNVYVQSVVFPVRYRDFDQDAGEGIVEAFFKRFIDPLDGSYESVDMIYTMSQDIVQRFNLDRFASRKRSGARDNEFITNRPFPANLDGNQFYETTLPIPKIVVNPRPSGFNFDVYLSQTYKYLDQAGKSKSYLVSNVAGAALIGDDPNADDPTNLLPINQDQTRIRSEEGSGGDYLSNEIFYRVARLRTEYAASLPTGHLHLPKIQGSAALARVVAIVTVDFNGANTKKIIDDIKKIIINSAKP